MISIRLGNISKSFGRTAALDGVSLELNEPGIYGIVGSNGSGKTTLLKILTNLSIQTSGTLRISEGDSILSPEEFLQMTGVVVGTPRFRKGIRGIDLLRLTSEVKGFRKDDPEITRAVETVSAQGFVNGFISEYSKGMMQRILLANGLIGKPRVLILDEPTSGLDPESREALHSVVRMLNDGSRIIVFTSHDLWEVEYLCTKATVLEAGHLMNSWINTGERKYVYITLRPGIMVDETFDARVKSNAGRVVLVADIAKQNDIVEHYGNNVDSIQKGSELPELYLTDFRDKDGSHRQSR